ncbi:zinc finger protein RFP-like [Elgaria multicarinata webbii]|uniref:zinc finger protein RFP-like n=1 Tax=Elgaria multicarinata webbii TaxID=159646 RepID=UPI002FCD3A48
MAAAESPRKRLREEATCSVCLDFFTDPVMLDCGHNFCQACIEKCWGDDAPTDASKDVTCPKCRERVQQRSLKRNKQLANVTEIAKELSVLVKAEGGGWKVCEWHQEPLKLFCIEDEAPICVVCDRSKEHRAHNVVPLQEAAQEYEDRICSCLETLKMEREKILAYKADAETESRDLLKQMEAEKEKLVVLFQQLRQFLEEQEKLLLAQMDEVEKEIVMKRDEHLAKISEDLSSLERKMQEMEEKCQQSSSEILQGIRSTFKRYEKNTFEKSVAFPNALKWRIWDFSDINPFLEGCMKQFKDALISGLQLKKANVSLDPDTANYMLILFEDHKSVREVETDEEGEDDLPDNPERFDECSFLLGREGFTAGRHFWEVAVKNEGQWSVGVARKSMRRKGQLTYDTEEGIWDLGEWDGECRHSQSDDPLSVSGELKRIRVSLNHDGGRVAFYNADTAALIFVYTAAPFSGETLLPFFSLSGTVVLTIAP